MVLSSDDTMIYFPLNSNGLLVINVTNLTNPEIVTTIYPSNYFSITMDKKMAYSGSNGNYQLVNLSNFTASSFPILVSATGWLITGLAYSDVNNLIFIVEGSQWLRILNSTTWSGYPS